MATKEINNDKARFDTRITREQKEFFERAARIGGYRSLTDFVVLTVQEKAKEIIAEKEQVLISQKDSEVFFEAIMNGSKPNEDLLKAASDYKDFLSE
jgi:uncharacterized protein (DUF1778 family)